MMQHRSLKCLQSWARSFKSPVTFRIERSPISWARQQSFRSSRECRIIWREREANVFSSSCPLEKGTRMRRWNLPLLPNLTTFPILSFFQFLYIRGEVSLADIQVYSSRGDADMWCKCRGNAINETYSYNVSAPARAPDLELGLRSEPVFLIWFFYVGRSEETRNE